MDVTASTIRRISVIGVAETIILLTVSIALLPLGYPKTHARLMAYTVLPLFVYSVAMVYLASSRPRHEKTIYPLLILFLALYALLPLTVLSGFTLLQHYYGAVSILSSAPFFIGGASKKGSLRLSLLLLGFSMLQTGVILLSAARVLGADFYPPKLGLLALIGYPVTAIYAVSIHAVPRTYKAQPHGIASALLVLLLLSGLTSFTAGYYKISLTLYALSLLVYPLSIKLYRLNEWLRETSTKKSPGRPGNLYFLYGHIFVALFSLISAYAVAGFALGYIGNVFTAIHLVAMGFIGVHIYIHAPMMLPVVVGVATKRRYTMLPFILLLLATLVWPLNGPLSLLLFLLSLCRTLDIILGFVPENLYRPFMIK